LKRANLPLVFSFVTAMCSACVGPNVTPTPDQAFRAHPPEVAAGLQVRVPAVHQVTLANGLRVFAIESPEAQTIHLTFADRAAVDSDETNPGLAALTAAAMGFGTVSADGSVTRSQDLLDGSRHFVLTRSGTVFGLVVLPSEAAAGFGALAGLVQKPALDQAAIQQARSQTKVLFAEESENALGSLTRLAAVQLYGKTSIFSRPLLGSEEERSLLGDEAVRRFYAERYQPAESALLVVGSLTALQAFALARDHFESWHPKATARGLHDTTAKLALQPDRPMVTGVNGSDTVAHLVLLMPCPRRNSPDTVSADLTAILVGNLMDSGLRARLRHDAGTSYSVSARCVQDRAGGIFSIVLDTDPLQFDTALDAVIQQMEQLRRGAPTAGSLAEARALYLGRDAARLGTSAGLESMLLDQFLAGLPDDYSATLEAQVNATTPDDIVRFAQRYLDPAHMAVAVHGSKTLLADPPSRLGGIRWVGLSAAQRGD
jgi:predicted Zn-dependent peptidase